jgi:hypothetical protein
MALVQNAVRMFLPVIFGARKVEATSKKVEEVNAFYCETKIRIIPFL